MRLSGLKISSADAIKIYPGNMQPSTCTLMGLSATRALKPPTTAQASPSRSHVVSTGIRGATMSSPTEATCHLASGVPAPAAHPGQLLHWEGLRGLLCLSVVGLHYAFFFHPAAAGIIAAAPSTLSAWATTPLRFVLEGQWSVAVFFCLSGYFLPHKFMRKSDPSLLVSSTFARYGRLAFPILASSLVTLAMLKLNMFQYTNAAAQLTGSWWPASIMAHVPANVTVLDTVISSTWTVLTTPFAYVLNNPSLWMMHWELIGSFLALSLALLAKSTRHSWVLYSLATLFCLLPSYIIPCRFYLPLVAGVALSQLDAMNESRRVPFQLNKPATAALVTASLYLASYPRFSTASVMTKASLPTFASSISPDMYWSFLHTLGSLAIRPDKVFILWHSLSAAMLCAAVAFSPSLQNLLSSSKPLVKLGERSFSVMLLHCPILFALMPYLVMVPFQQYLNLPLDTAIASAAAVTLPTILAASWLWHAHVDMPLARFNKWVITKVFPKATASNQPGTMSIPRSAEAMHMSPSH